MTETIHEEQALAIMIAHTFEVAEDCYNNVVEDAENGDRNAIYLLNSLTKDQLIKQFVKIERHNLIREWNEKKDNHPTR